ncbi:MAG TPA: hypothetical protein VHB79_12920 [Polyangiaceae bacterium]|nr:hypothetical protein [Polyangiaceae bacterium]
MRSESRALLRYLVRLLLFAAPLFGVTAGLELGLRRVGTLHHSRAQRFAAGNLPATVLVTGNSHETVGVICQKLGRPCLKLAAGSQGVLYDHLLIERYQAGFVEPRLLLIGLSFYSFKYSLGAIEGWREFEYWHAYGIDGERRPLPFFDPRRFLLLATYPPQTTLDWALKRFPVQLGAARADARGDVDVSTLVQRERGQSALVRRVRNHMGNMRAEVLPETRKAVSGMIEWAKSRGATPVLLVSPVTRDYARAVSGPELDGMHAEVARLQQSYGVQVADYMTDERFSDAEFYDFDHLTRAGAEHFTAILREEVVEPVLARSR